MQAGNIFFRRLVRAKQEEYLKANKREKTMVAKDIVSIIRKLAPPGRFLKKHPKNEAMYGKSIIGLCPLDEPELDTGSLWLPFDTMFR